MTDEEFRLLQAQARREASRNVFPASGSDDDTPYDVAARHCENGASAH
ncbi:hypothetical protein OG361_03595 [Streptomyces sp. NBC_00090]